MTRHQDTQLPPASQAPSIEGPRLPPLRRTSKRKAAPAAPIVVGDPLQSYRYPAPGSAPLQVSAEGRAVVGVVASSESGHQRPGTLHRLLVDRVSLPSFIRSQIRIGGSKSEALGLCSAAPKVEQSLHDGVLAEDSAGPCRMGWADLDGFVRSEEDYAHLKEFFKHRAWAYIHSSGSHNPLGGHPNPLKCGQWRLRVFWIFDQVLSHDQYRHAVARVLADLAAHFGHGPIEVKGSSLPQLRKTLKVANLDPASIAPCQKAYCPTLRAEIADQRIDDVIDGGDMPVDIAGIDRQLAAEKEEAEKAKAEAAEKVQARQAKLAKLAAQAKAQGKPCPLAKDGADRIARARAYLAGMGGAVDGAGGHAATWAAILACWGFALELDDAWTVLEAWNASCSPPWDCGELRDKLTNAYAGGIALPAGFMLAAPEKEETLEAFLGGGGDQIGASSSDSPDCHNLADKVNLRPQVVTKTPTTPPTNKSRYIPPHTGADLAATPLLIVQAPTGAGKTTAFVPALAELQSSGQRDITINHRRSLCGDLAETFDRPLYSDHSSRMIEGPAVVCLNSIMRVSLFSETDEFVELGQKPIDLLICDEFDQIVRSLKSKTLKDRAAVWSYFKALIRSSKTVAVQSADMPGYALRALRAAYGPAWEGVRKEAKTIRLTHAPGIEVDIIEHRPAYLEELEEALAARESGEEEAPGIFETLSSKAETKARCAWIRSEYPHIRLLEVHSDNIGEMLPILKDKNQVCMYDAIVCSPVLGTGYNLDSEQIQAPCDLRVFGHFVSNHGPIAHDAKQALSRVRHPHGGRWTVYVGGATQGPDTYHPTAETLLTDLRKACGATTKKLGQMGVSWDLRYDVSGQPIIAPQDEELCKILCDVEAFEMRWSRLAGPSGALAEHLGDAGYSVTYHPAPQLDKGGQKTAGEVTAEAVRVHGESVKEAERIEILSADPMTPAEAKEAELKDLDKRDKRRLTRFRIQDYLGIQYADVTIDHIEWWERKGARKATAYVDYCNVLDGYEQAPLAADWRSLHHGVAADCNNRWLKAKTLPLILALFGLSPDLREDARKGTVATIPAAIGPKAKTVLRRVFGFKGAAKKPAQILSTLLKQIGLKTSSTQRRIGKERIREYRIDLESIDAMNDRSRAQIDRSRRTHYIATRSTMGDPIPQSIIDELMALEDEAAAERDAAEAARRAAA